MIFAVRNDLVLWQERITDLETTKICAPAVISLGDALPFTTPAVLPWESVWMLQTWL